MVTFNPHGSVTLVIVVCWIVARLLLRAGQMSSGVQLERRLWKGERMLCLRGNTRNTGFASVVEFVFVCSGFVFSKL